MTISGPTLTSCRYRCISRLAVTLSDRCCCLYRSTGLPPVPSSLTTLGNENRSRNSRSGMYPPLELEPPSAVASLELGRDFGSEGISSLDIVENSPFDDMISRVSEQCRRANGPGEHRGERAIGRSRLETTKCQDQETDATTLNETVLFRVTLGSSRAWRHLIPVVAVRARRLLSKASSLSPRYPLITA